MHSTRKRTRLKIVLNLLALISLFVSSAAFGSITATYTYDNLHRLTRVDRSDGSYVYYAYDENGNRTSKLSSTINEPVAVNDGYSVLEGGVLNQGAVGVLSNDTHADGSTITAVKVTDPAHGLLTLNADGSFTYVHDGTETTNDSFTYKAKDGSVDTNVATVTITVIPLNDAPTIDSIGNVTVNENAGLQTVLLYSITAGPGESQSLTVTATSSNHGLIPDPTVSYASPAATGSLSFTPVANASGTATVTVTVDDGQPANNSVGITFQVTVAPLNWQLLFYDDFEDGVIGSFWSPFGKNVYESSGMLQIQENVTDTVARVEASFQPASIIKVEMRHYMHAANNYFHPSVNFEFADKSGVGLNWIRSGYSPDHCNKPDGYNKVQIRNSDGCVISNLVSSDYYDKWITSYISYDTQSGKMDYDIGGDGTVEFTAIMPELDRKPVQLIRIGAYGWFTGHYHNIDWIKIYTSENNAPTLDAIADLSIDEDTGQQSVLLGGITAGPGENQALTVTATSSNQGLIPEPSVDYTSPAETGSISFTPVANADGSATITVTVNDGQASNNTFSQTFKVTVAPINHAPVAVGVQTEVTFGGANDDTGNAIRSTSDGGYIIAGGTTSFGDGSGEAYLIKIDGAGIKEWENHYGAARDEGVTDVVVTSDGGYAVTGGTTSFGGARVRGYLLRTDSAGAMLWEKAFGGPDVTIGRALLPTADGGFMVASQSTDTDPWLDIRLSKHDVNGDEEWIKYYGRDHDDGVRALKQLPGGGYLLVGNSGYWGSNPQAWIIKTDASGNKVAEATWGGTGAEWGIDGVLTPDGGYLVAGSTNSYGAGGYDIFLLKLDSALQPVWYKTFGEAFNDYPNKVYQRPDGNVVVVGNSEYAAANNDMWVIETDPSGTLLSSTKYGGTADDLGAGAVVTASAIAVVGQTASFSAGGYDVYLVGNAFGGVTTSEDTATPITLIATDADNDPLTYTVVTGPEHGSVSGISPNITYTPERDYYGSDCLTFKADDGQADSNVATVTITVTPVNDAPVAVNDSFTVAEGGTLNQAAPGVLGNDTDAEDNPRTAVKVTDPAHGTLTLNANGSFTYLHDGTETTSDSFTYKASDGSADSTVATVTIAAMPVNDAPTLDPIGNITIYENAGGQTVSLTGITSGSGESQTLSVTASSSNTALIMNPTVSYTSPSATGSVVFTPVANASGTATITITVDDGHTTNNTESELFTVTVNPVNEPPSFTKGADQTVREDAGPQTVFGWATGISAGAGEFGQVLTFNVTGNSNPGLFAAGPAVNATTGTLEYTPVANANGGAMVTVTLNDNGGTANGGGDTSASQTFTITMTPVNDSPMLDLISGKFVAKGNKISFRVDGSDPDGDNLTFIAEEIPAAAIFDPETRLFTWTPGSADAGEHRVTFTVTDDGVPALSDSEVIVVTVGDLRLVCASGCAYDTIQGAIDAADAWDMVQVAAGYYRENLWIEKSLTLRRGTGLEITPFDMAADQGASAASWLVINGDLDSNGAGDGSVVTIAPPAGEEIRVRLENLILTGGWAENGGGILVTATEGGAADVTVVNTVVALNDATRGGGIALRADGAGSAIDLQLINSTVGWNDAGEGGGLYAEGVNSGAVTMDATNQIVWGNRSAAGDDIHIVQDGGGTVLATAEFSVIGGVSFGGDYPGSWNAAATVSDANPLYADPALLDLRLAEGSPAIDAGEDEDGLTEDFEGDARPQGDGVDIGADEHTAVPALASLKLTSLNGGEGIAAGEPYLITWSALAGTNNFGLWYSLNGGTSWKSLTRTPLVDTNCFTWQVPLLATNSTRCLIKITGVLNGRVVLDKSDKTFTVEVVRLMSPNGKEHLISGDEVPIAWKTYGTKLPVATTGVQYSVNGGSTWKTVATLPGNPGFYDWPVPAAVSAIGKCRVQVVLRAANGAIVGKDMSDANFNTGKVLVLAPNGGEVIASGGTVAVAWDALTDAVSFDLYYTLNGKKYLPLPGGQDVTGSTWQGTWPISAGNMVKSAVKVMGYTSTGMLVGSDFSDGFFTTEVVRIQSPNGGETITGGASTTITWATNASLQKVAKTTVSTSVNGGSSWSKTVLDGNPGTLSWTPVRPTRPLPKGKVKVELRDATGALIGNDTSDAFFTVQP
ncbi:MAG: tandem-95 repeat protein [Candidatus Methylomirabilia bacterium]